MLCTTHKYKTISNLNSLCLRKRKESGNDYPASVGVNIAPNFRDFTLLYFENFCDKQFLTHLLLLLTLIL